MLDYFSISLMLAGMKVLSADGAFINYGHREVDQILRVEHLDWTWEQILHEIPGICLA